MKREQIRTNLLEVTSMMASAEAQIEYQNNIQHVFVPIEIVEMFCTDVYHPKCPKFVEAFSEPELKSIARLYGDACRAGESIEKLDRQELSCALKDPNWRVMMNTAKFVSQWIERSG